jgi:hypothetical protein
MSETSCPNDTCKGWFQFQAGLCVSPFEVDPDTDLSICSAAPEGNSDRSERDWCYWYAAYQKSEAEICENIEWDEMKERCVAGGDPDDYYILWYPASQ